MQGLVKEDSNGNIVCNAAQNYEISPNGTVYTFTLKENLKWSNGDKVTAKDFVFSIKRIFLNETSTPNKSSFLCIKNAQEILNGEKDLNSLSVRAISDYKLEITLSSPNPNFLYTLTTPAAYPCNQEFFESTKGRYGYNYEELIFNGPFIIQKTSDNYVQLIANSKSPLYHQNKDKIIVLYTNKDYDKEKRLLEKTTDFGKISTNTAKTISPSDFNIYQFESSTWVLGFNQANDIFKNTTLRKALFSAINNIIPNIHGYPNYALADGLVVPSIKLNSLSYRNMVQSIQPFWAEDTTQLLKDAFKELNIKGLEKLTIICPDNEIFKYYITYLQKAWNEKTGTIVNFVALKDTEFYQRLDSGDYDLAIFPINATENSVTSQLEKFCSYNNYNYLSYQNHDYDALIDKITLATSFSEIANLSYKAEKFLVENAVIIPLFYEKDFFALSASNQSVNYSPYGPTVDFTNAYKK
jgi:oligopeptide transport system substrate-binding protein